MCIDSSSTGNGFSLEPPSSGLDRVSSAKVDIVRRDVFQRLVVAVPVVVRDKAVNFPLELLRGLPDDQVDPLFAGAMVALDLAIGLRMVR